MATAIKEKSMIHKFTGEKITFLESSQDTNGEYEYVEMLLPPNGEGQPLHYHKHFEEQFEVLEGKLKVVKGSHSTILEAGKKLLIPKETNHVFINASSEEPVKFRIRMTPAHHFEQSMRILYGLMEDDKTDEKGFPNDRIHIALILEMQDSHVVELPLY
ncbi:cupin domain-containing protein [Piscibacillus salipiscarius]|uniref:cupin domain-containing protein n=1 Tax=Piscibacillus salipiscarius TaxID=299480 RepID=UPI0006CF5C37|nr:cupin domain-containing protein [Piscibacillus salipiscarius]